MGDRLGATAIKGLAPIATTYVMAILLPAHPQMKARYVRELQTLAKALDLLIVGKAPEASDLLMQRLKALETAFQDGHWQVAQHGDIRLMGSIFKVSSDVT